MSNSKAPRPREDRPPTSRTTAHGNAVRGPGQRIPKNWKRFGG
jgi:hypothetical protein